MTARNKQTGPTPLTCSWIDIWHYCYVDGVYWNRETLRYSDAQWLKLIRHLRRDLGVEVLFLQNAIKSIKGDHRWALYPSRIVAQRPPRVGDTSEDPVRAILRACATEQIQLFIGAGMFESPCLSGCFGDTTDEALNWELAIFAELLERYGDEPAFTGFYTCREMHIFGNGRFREDQVAFMQRYTQALRQLDPQRKIAGHAGVLAVNPQWGKGPRPDDESLPRDIERIGYDYLTYGDGVGFWLPDNVPYPAAEWRRVWETLRTVHDKTATECWTQLETFRFETFKTYHTPLVPGPWAQIRPAIEAAAPYVHRLGAYTIPGIMTSQEVCPGLGAPETETLYRAYQAWRGKDVQSHGQ